MYCENIVNKIKMYVSWPAIFAVIFPHLGGVINYFFTKGSIDEWYKKLKRPVFTPPNWVFGPVWTVLYCAMGYASYLVWKEGGGFKGSARLPLIIYLVQLALNWSYGPVFFGLRDVEMGFYVILALDVAVIITGILFFKVQKTAGYLFIPYLAWLSLATTLSYFIYHDNPTSEDNKRK